MSEPRMTSFWRYLWCVVRLKHLDPSVLIVEKYNWRCKRCGCKVTP